MPLIIDPQTGALIDSKELGRKQNQQKNLQDINRSYGIDTEDVVPEAEDNNEVSGAIAFAAGIGSGIINSLFHQLFLMVLNLLGLIFLFVPLLFFLLLDYS